MIVFAVAVALYGATAAQAIQWQDSGLFVLRAMNAELINPMGLALSHPLQYACSRALILSLPLEPAHAASLASALFGAIAVANVFGIVRTIQTRPSLAAPLLAAGGLLVANTFWRLSTIPESYTIAAALLSCEIWCLVRWWQTRRAIWLMLAFASAGLGFSNHNLALLSLPVTGSILLHAAYARQIGWRGFVASLGAWCVGGSLYLGLVAMQGYRSGDWLSTIHSALFGHAFEGAVMGSGLSWKLTAASIAFTLLSFPNLMLPAAGLGILAKSTTSRAIYWTLGAILAIHLLFVLRYNVVDQYMFLTPAYGLLAIFAGLGFGRLMHHKLARPALIAAAVLMVLTPAVYPLARDLARSKRILGTMERHKPYRDDYHYLMIPWGAGHNSADRLSRKAVDLAKPDGLIFVEDSMARFAVEYQAQREGSAIKVRTPDPETRLPTDRPVVWIPARTDRPPNGIVQHWAKVGPLYIGPR